jgi:hypothetical protein
MTLVARVPGFRCPTIPGWRRAEARPTLLHMLLPLLGVLALAVQLPAATLEHGAFGFPNPEGTEIIVLANLPATEQLRTAICYGDVIPVRAFRRQEVGRSDRDVPEQFARLKGQVFRVATGKANPSDACLLVPDMLMEKSRIVRTQSMESPGDCSDNDRRRLAAMRQRPIATCWAVGKILPGGAMFAVEYARTGTDALAAVIVEVDGRAVTLDLPAKYVKDGEDLWRVDDGGKFQGLGIAIPFLIRRGNALVIPMLWAGAESLSVSVWVSDEAGSRTRQVIGDSWYRAPR